MSNLLELQKEFFLEKSRLRFLYWYENKKYSDQVLEGYKDTYFFNPEGKTPENQSLNVAEAITLIYEFMSEDIATTEAPHIGPLIFIAFFTMLESILEEEFNDRLFNTREEALEAIELIKLDRMIHYINLDISKSKENGFWINVKIFGSSNIDLESIITNN